MVPPEDLDPDYAGMFNALENKSLFLGLGLRLKHISLIHFHCGAFFYKQEDVNPLIDDLTTNISPYFGLSLNWDAVETVLK